MSVLQNLPGIDLVQSFLAVADELSFRRGAERLNIEQSALTRRIQRLEHLLGFSLFERTTREVRLTPAGRIFYQHNSGLAGDYLNSVQSARLVAEGKAGALRISYMAFAATGLMPMAVARYRQSYPHIDIRLQYIRTQGQKLALAQDEVDFGFLIGPFEHSDFHSIRLKTDPLYVIMPKGHRLAGLAEIRLTDLEDENLVLGDMQQWEAYRWLLSERFAAEGIRLNIGLAAPDTLALIGLVAAGLGVTIYPGSLIGISGLEVEARPIADAPLEIETVLAWKRSNRSKAALRFVEIAREVGAGRQMRTRPGAPPNPG